jgi:hypothetical protein
MVLLEVRALAHSMHLHQEAVALAELDLIILHLLQTKQEAVVLED